MLSRWISLVVLGIMSVGPGLFWSPASSKPKSESALGWSATPLPQSALEAASKLNLFSFGLAIKTQPPMAQVPAGLFPKFQLNYQTPRLGGPLYLLYSKLQSDGG